MPRREWTKQELKEFNRKASAPIRECARAAMVEKYGMIAPHLTGAAPIYWYVHRGSMTLCIKTCVYGQRLSVGFVHLETAQRWAERVGGKVAASPYFIADTLNANVGEFQ